MILLPDLVEFVFNQVIKLTKSANSRLLTSAIPSPSTFYSISTGWGFKDQHSWPFVSSDFLLDLTFSKNPFRNGLKFSSKSPRSITCPGAGLKVRDKFFDHVAFSCSTCYFSKVFFIGYGFTSFPQHAGCYEMVINTWRPTSRVGELRRFFIGGGLNYVFITSTSNKPR